MSSILLPIFYLPPVSWFSAFYNAEDAIYLEQFEHFPKQTYRNRTMIFGANGKLPLIIPIKHNGNRILKDIEISYTENWQSIHWKSVANAYQSSPYFEYYEQKLKAIFDFQTQSLMQFNLHAIQVLEQIIKTGKTYQLTSQYSKNPISKDFRNTFCAKKESLQHFEEYYQVFSNKFGFLENLSILDLLCNKGPETATYLRDNKLSITI